MAGLPNPQSCTWLEAEHVAEILEALAGELTNEVSAAAPRWPWARARRVERLELIKRIRFRAYRYRSRQYDLHEGRN